MTFIRYSNIKELKKQVWKFMYIACKVCYLCLLEYLPKQPHINLILWKVRVNKMFLKLSAQTHEASDFSGIREYHLLSKWHLMLETSDMSLDINWCKCIKRTCNWFQILKKSEFIVDANFLQMQPVFPGLVKQANDVLKNFKWI